MAYNEHIYIQKMSGEATNPHPCYDVLEEFKLWGKEIPFKVGGEIKGVFTQEWVDEDGDDELVPDVLMMKGYEMKWQLAYKGDKDSANRNINRFVEYLTGRSDGGGAMFYLYSTYTGIGRRYVRFVRLEDDAKLERKADYDLLIISIVLKVNDPSTEIFAPTMKTVGGQQRLSF